MVTRLPVTRAQLDACIALHRDALTGVIRDCGRSTPPVDGAIGRLGASLAFLECVQAEDDPAPLVEEYDAGVIEQTGEPVRGRRRRLRPEE